MRTLHGDVGFAGRGPESWDPDAWAWLPGVDYAAGWRAARDAAEEVNELLVGCGVERWQLRAIADTDAQGRGWVRLVGPRQGWERLQQLLQLATEKAPEEVA